MTGNEDNNDSELNRYLQGDSEISKRYAGNKAMLPPNELDRKILGAAASWKTAGKKVEKHRFHRARWALPLSVAAIITLSVTLVLNMPLYSRYPVVNDEDYYNSVPATTESKNVLPEERLEETVIPEQDVAPAAVRRKAASESFAVPELEELSVDMPASAIKKERSAYGAPALQTQSIDETLRKEPKRTPPARIFNRDIGPVERPAAKAEAMQERTDARSMPKLRELSVPDELGLSDQAVPASVSELPKDKQLDGPESWLMKIKSLFKQGENDLARQEWQEFRVMYPEFPEDTIRQILTDKYFSELAGSQNK